MKTGVVWINALSRLLPDSERDNLAGDFLEVYSEYRRDGKSINAFLLFMGQVFRSMPHFIRDSFFWRTRMIRNYFTVAYRNLMRYKVFSAINIIGLSVGMAIFLLSMAYMFFEFSFDKFHPHSDRIYGLLEQQVVNQTEVRNRAIVPAPMLAALRAEFPEIENGTRYFKSSRCIIRLGDQSIAESGMFYVDPNFLEFFHFPMAEGDPKSALSQPYTIVLTPQTALKYFGDGEAVGKTLTIDNRIRVTVSGIVDKVPPNSSIRFDGLISMETARALYGWMDDWKESQTGTFIRLAPGTDAANLTAKLEAFRTKYYPEGPSMPRSLFMLALTQFHPNLESMKISSYLYHTIPYYVLYWFLGMSGSLLLVVIINFINLSTARYMLRIKEVGLRKVIGANRMELVRQFLGESFFLCLVSLPLVLILYEIIRPMFISGMKFEMDLNLQHYPLLTGGILILTLLIGLFSGLYPAFYLSRFKPVDVLRGQIVVGRKRSLSRKILVVLQFIFGLMFMIFSMGTRSQLNHLMTANFGHSRDRIVVLDLPQESRSQMDALKTALLNHPEIDMVAGSRTAPVDWMSRVAVIPQGTADEPWQIIGYGVDTGFPELMSLRIVKGRTFDKAFQDENSVILNETAVRQLKWDDPIGKEFALNGRKHTVIGVLADYQFYDAHFPVQSALLYLSPASSAVLLVHHTQNISGQEVVDFAKSLWAGFFPNLPMEYTTLNNLYEQSISYVPTIEASFTIMGALSVAFAGLGLLALASYSTGRRIKEIGIRKVMGASEMKIVGLLLWEFIRLAVLANVIGLPLTYWGLKAYLQSSWGGSPAPISPWFFILSVCITVLTAVVAVIVQTLKAARTDPARSLRYE